MDSTAYRDDLLDLPLGENAEEREALGDDAGPKFDPLPAERQSDDSPPPRGGRSRVRIVLVGVLAAAAAAAAAWVLKPSPAVLAPAEPMLDFQDVQLGGASQRRLSISNRGEARLVMVRTDLGGADAADFVVTSDLCSGKQLAHGESCELEVSFRPTARGRRAATLVLEGEAANAPRTVPLLGQGTAPELSISPAALRFGPQLVGTAGATFEARIVNRGTSALAIGSVSVEGLGAGDFAERSDRCRGRALAPGAECVVGVRFLPTVAGPRQATLWLRSESGDAAQVALEGEGLALEPLLRLGTERLDLGMVPVEETGPAASLVIANDGSGPLSLRAIELGGADAGVFTIDAAGCLSVPILAAGGCTAEVNATPPRVGTFEATVRIAHDGGGGEVTLTAVGIAPLIRVSPLRIGLGEVPLGRRSGAETLSVENVGMAPLRLSRLVLDGSDASAFTLGDDGCSRTTLTTGQTCTVRVTVEPRRPGPLRATVVVRHNAGQEQIPVTGFGVAGRLVVEPGRLDFEGTEVGTSRERRLVLRNRGRAPLRIRPPRLEGAGRGTFRIAGSTCSAPLVPDATCTVTITFLPTVPGRKQAQLVLAHDGDGGPATVDLAARGTAPPAPRLSAIPSSVDFGELRVASRSEIETLRLTNTGDGTLGLRDLRITGPDAADFRIVPGSCTGAGFITAGQSCTVGVRFTPSGPGRREARLELVHSAEGARVVGLVGGGL